MRSATKVGIAVVLAVSAFLAAQWYILSLGWRAEMYSIRVRFGDIQDLEDGAHVRMAGVRIGTVRSIDLVADESGRIVAELGLDVLKKYKIPKDSRFRITSGGLIGEKYVDIIPGTKREYLPQNQKPTVRDVVYGVDTPQLDDLIIKASELADETSRIAANIESASAAIDRLIRDQRLGRDLRAIVANTERATRRADALIADIRQMVVANRPEVARTARNIADATEGFKELAQVIQSLVTESDLQGSLQETLGHVKAAAANIEQASANVAKLSGDEGIQADLRATVASLRQSAENTRQITERINETVNRILGRRRAPAEAGTAVGPPPPPTVSKQTSVDVYQTVNPGRFRLDVNSVWPMSGGRFAYIGLRDVGESAKLNLQLGRTLTDNLDVRYGFYASRLGVGLDYGLTSPSGFSLNLYHPNDLKLDVYGKTRLGPNMSLYFGLESALRRNNPTIGLQFRR